MGPLLLRVTLTPGSAGHGAVEVAGLELGVRHARGGGEQSDGGDQDRDGQAVGLRGIEPPGSVDGVKPPRSIPEKPAHPRPTGAKTRRSVPDIRPRLLDMVGACSRAALSGARGRRDRGLPRAGQQVLAPFEREKAVAAARRTSDLASVQKDVELRAQHSDDETFGHASARSVSREARSPRDITR